MEYLKRETNAFHREDFFLARIAMEIKRGNVKNPSSIKIDEFLLKFGEDEKKTAVNKMNSKETWKAILGVQS